VDQQWYLADSWNVRATHQKKVNEWKGCKILHSQRIRRIATPYLPWAKILLNLNLDDIGFIIFRVNEVFHKLGVEEVILVYTPFEEGTNLENYDVKLFH
jgi:hypothetical protein